MKILIIGRGFIGKRCHEAWGDSVMAEGRVNSVEDVVALIEKHRPDAILNAAGVVGKPNVDWCETHPLETIQGNTTLPLLIAEACQQKQIYLLHIGTGCVYYGYSPDPLGWKEDEPANPSAVYTRSKYAADLTLSTLPRVGIARIRMPIDEISFAGNLINKLASYTKVADVRNSVTVIEDMIGVFYALLSKQASGIFHVTNPGVMKHRDLVELYEKYVDPKHHNEWITADNLVEQGLAKKIRSNTILQSTRLEQLGIHMRPIQEALEDVMKKFATNKGVSSPFTC